MSQDQSGKEAVRPKSRKIKVYLGLLVSALCFWWVFSSVEGDEIFDRFHNVKIGYLLLAVLATFGSYVLRSIRWPFFFEKNPPTFRSSFDCLIIGFFMNNVLPARIGEFVRAHIGGKATNQSRSTVLATIAGERLADGLMISLLFALLFTFGSPVGNQHVGMTEVYAVAYFFLFAGTATVVMLLMRSKIFSLLEYFQTIMPGNVSKYTLLRVQYFIQGLSPLLRPGRVLVLTLFSASVWLLELFVYYLVSLGFDQPMSIGGLSLFLAAVNFSSLIPAAPGGAGVIEVFGTLALERIGIDRETALAMVASQHLIQFFVVGIPGASLFFLKLGGKLPDPREDAEEEELAEEGPFRDVSGPRPPDSETEAADLLVPTVDQDPGESLDLSIIIPAYNEEVRLPKALLEISEYFKSRKVNFEVLVVDDGSTDETSKVVRQFESLSPHFRLLVYPKNRGKGYAVRFGVLNARGALVLYADADGATPIVELERLESAIKDGAQVAIGSRAMFSRDTEVKTVWYRIFIGRVFSGIVNVLLLPGIADTQCGFKLFIRPVARHIFSHQKADRFSFDVEVLFLARKAGCKIAEVPINWTNVPGSKVNLINDSLAMFIDLLRFRLRDFFGGYGNLGYVELTSSKSSKRTSSRK